MSERQPKPRTPKEKQDQNRDTEILHRLEMRYIGRANRHESTVAGGVFDLEQHTIEAVSVVRRLSIVEIENLTDEQKKRLSGKIKDVLETGTALLSKVSPDEEKNGKK